MREWGEELHITCCVWYLNMTWYMCGSGCVDNVCNVRDQNERAWTRATSQVYMADSARRDKWGARWDLETS